MKFPVRATILLNALVLLVFAANFNFPATEFFTTDGGKLGTVLRPVCSLDSPVTAGSSTSSDGHPGTLLEDGRALFPPLADHQRVAVELTTGNTILDGCSASCTILSRPTFISAE